MCDTLKKSLKEAFENYWRNQDNYLIDGIGLKGLSKDCKVTFLDFGFFEEGKVINQFEKLIEILLYNKLHSENKKSLPELKGRFQVKKEIDNGNGSQMVNYEFELLSNDYEVLDCENVIIKDVFLIKELK